MCKSDNSRIYHDKGIDEMEVHQMIICNPNKEHSTQNTIKCLYGKMNIEHIIEYTNQFWRAYKNNRKFSLIVSNDSHEGSLETVKYLDDIILNYLKSLFNDNLLKESSIFLLSDHGCGLPSIYY